MMSARCLRCGAGNEWIEGKPTLTDERASPRLKRGLGWIVRHVVAIYEDVGHERGTGQFAGTNKREVEEAIEWLRARRGRR